MSKRDWDRLVAICLILVSAAIVLALTYGVLNFTYSDRASRDAERYQASTTETQKSDQEDVCLSLTAPQEIANCVRQQDAAARDQKQTQSDLHAQHDMAAFAHGLLWFSALSFITGAGGFVALVWTFSETRKMTRSQESAYVELTGISFHTHGTYGANVSFTLSNCGRTPAKDIKFVGTLQINGTSYDHIYDVVATLAVLPGDSERAAAGRIPDFLSHFENILSDYNDFGSHGRNTGTILREDDSSPDPNVRLVGKIVWHTIYGDPEIIPIDNWAELQSGGSPVWVSEYFRDPKHNAKK